MSLTGPQSCRSTNPTQRWSAAPARSTASWRRPIPTPISSSISPTHSSCWWPPSCPRRAPTSASTWSRRSVFARYPDAAAYAAADRAELEELIKPTGFFRAKTDTLIKLGAALTERFGGEVPKRMKDLVTLPGVGRKTANVVLGNAFGVPGITVDTHFGRLVRRFGWTTETDPDKVEARSRRTVPAQGLDAALPQRHLARPAALPCPEPGLRRLPGRSLVPRVRGRRDRPGQGRQAGPGAARMMSRLAACRLAESLRGSRRARDRACWLRWTHRCQRPTTPVESPTEAAPSPETTADLAAMKKAAGIADCPRVGPEGRGRAVRTARRRVAVPRRRP